MFTYSLNAVIGKDAQGNFVYKTFVIEAETWQQAQEQLNTLVQEAQSKQ